MSSPMSLGWLSQVLIALAVAAAVVLLYLLKPSPRRLDVSSALIWRRVLRSRRRAPDRLRWWLSLLLALLIAQAMAVALTAPGLNGARRGAGKLVVVLDDSLTLSALTADGRSRWDHALERARHLVLGGPAGGRCMIADTQRQIVTPRFESPADAITTLGRLRVLAGSHAAFPPLPAVGDSDVRTVLITDGVVGLKPAPGVETLSVFQPVDNAGITAFQVRALPADARRYQAYVEVTNASRGARDLELGIAGVGHAPLVRKLSLAAGASAGEIFDVSMFAGGPLRAQVTMARDGFGLDDVAFSYLPEHRLRRLGLITTGDPALERSLRLLPGVEVTAMAPRRYRESAGLDAWVFDRFAPKREPSLPALLLRPPHADWLPATSGVGADATFSWWLRGHALTDGLSLRDVTARRPLLLRRTEGFEVVAADGEGHPLILASSRGARRVEVTFALDDSNLMQQTGFPVLLSNALDWMIGEPPPIEAALGPVEVPVRAAKVLDLQGRAVATRELAGGIAFDALQPGFFTAVTADRRIPIAVSVTDPATTAVNASELAQAVSAVSAPAAAGLHWQTQPWILLLSLAAALLALEWWAFNRRVTV